MFKRSFKHSIPFCISESDTTDGNSSHTSESTSENASMNDMKRHSGSMSSMTSLSTTSSGVSSAAPVSDHPDKIEILKQKKELMEEGIKK